MDVGENQKGSNGVFKHTLWALFHSVRSISYVGMDIRFIHKQDF